MNKNAIRRILFFVVMVIALVSLTCVALADDPCPEGQPHKGPFSYRNRVNATCTETGSQDKYCDACGRFVGTEIISAIGHQYTESTKVITSPTCLTAGLQQKSTICKVCGYSGGKIKEIADVVFHVDINNMQIVEDVHLILNHLLMNVLQRLWNIPGHNM